MIYPFLYCECQLHYRASSRASYHQQGKYIQKTYNPSYYNLTYLGHSKNAIKVFTNREEQTIIDEFVQRNNGVKEYERKSLQRVIWEKIQDIKNSNPERDFSKYVSGNGVFRKGFAYKLAKKFGLSSRRTDKEQKYECEICYTSYTLMSSLKKHLRKVHFL